MRGVMASLRCIDHPQECQAIVAFDPNGLKRGRLHARLRLHPLEELTHPLHGLIGLDASATAPSRTTLSTTMRLPDRDSVSAHVKYDGY